MDIPPPRPHYRFMLTEEFERLKSLKGQRVRAYIAESEYYHSEYHHAELIEVTKDFIILRLPGRADEKHGIRNLLIVNPV